MADTEGLEQAGGVIAMAEHDALIARLDEEADRAKAAAFTRLEDLLREARERIAQMAQALTAAHRAAFSEARLRFEDAASSLDEQQRLRDRAEWAGAQLREAEARIAELEERLRRQAEARSYRLKQIEERLWALQRSPEGDK